jgi:pimeloyl-ACP methyl ester carboxylesterase
MTPTFIRRARLHRDRFMRRLRRRFPALLSEADESVLLNMDSNVRTLLLAVGGMSIEDRELVFEFLSVTETFPVKRLFVRDPRQAWYHCGMPHHGWTLSSVVESLRDLIAQHDVDRLVVVGSSSGGYAALVFGTLLGADSVLCFAPQTVLDLEILASMDDHRWDPVLGPLNRAGMLDRRWIDLRRALPAARCADTRYEIFFDDSFRVDRIHAERLSGIEGVRLYRFGRGGHRLVRMLRDSGALEQILSRALHAPGHAPATDAATGQVGTTTPASATTQKAMP